MSMISRQIDGLRQTAQVYRNLGRHATEQMLLDAADTICQFRDDLQRANAENAKMGELLAEIYPYAKAYLQEWLVFGGIDSKSYDWYLRLRELGVEVDK